MERRERLRMTGGVSFFLKLPYPKEIRQFFYAVNYFSSAGAVLGESALTDAFPSRIPF